eukprot:CAMPEP_0170556050 /NCGR_PEP_ID=MMETSP0211-20121228/15337_1 /TAXON_ID=311385 /ORGANISM="Pseudokeronopsis sp., Strain OXSARD2" /LENGTH=54 /DNA_ID=CAMNT_0010866147 /DNA_START=255 /DNA_END=416 /DNA_ORIENTATION=+
MGAHKFIHILGEKQVADLRTCFNGADLLHLQGIPEADASVCSSSSTRQQPMLKW